MEIVAGNKLAANKGAESSHSTGRTRSLAILRFSPFATGSQLQPEKSLRSRAERSAPLLY